MVSDNASEPKSLACSPHTPSSLERHSFDSLRSQSGSIGTFLSRRSLDARGLLWGSKTDAGASPFASACLCKGVLCVHVGLTPSLGSTRFLIACMPRQPHCCKSASI